MFSISRAHTYVKPPPLTALLPALKRKTKSEFAGPCWRCPDHGVDRFLVFSNGRGWCRVCGWKGDSIQLLRDRDGLSFREALTQLGCDLLPGPAIRRARAAKRAIAHVKERYRAWQEEKINALFHEYRDLDADVGVALTAYRQMQRCPELYDDAERIFWTHALSRVYDRTESVTQAIDFFMLSDYERERFALWQQEVCCER
jgi:hypothetical protein